LTWVALAAALVLLVGWLVYPVVLGMTGKAPGKFRDPESVADLPPVSILIATREPPAMVAARVANLLESDYPADRMQVVVAVDCGAGSPLGEYQAALPPGRPVWVIAGDAPGGKAANLNAAMRAAQAELVLFADSAQSWETPAARLLVRALEPDRVGGVTGAIGTDAERGIFGIFWRYESWLRTLESRTGRVVAVTGAIHGLKRSCWSDLPVGLICDDLLIPLRVARQGLWVVAEPRARARDPRRFDRTTQVQRKVRTLTGMLQVCAWEPWVLIPGAHRLWGAFLCHKLIRIATPFLGLVFVAGVLVALPAQWVAGALVIGTLAILGAARRLGWPPRRLGQEAFWAARLFAAPVQAVSNAIRGRWDIWHPLPR